MLSFEENFLFIKQLFNSAFKVEVNLLSSLYSIPITTDYGFRKIFWPDYDYRNDPTVKSLLKTPRNAIVCLHSKLGFSNILYHVPEPYESTMFIIGPFLTETLSNDFINTVLNINNFPISVVTAIQTYYQTLPYVNDITITNTLQTVLEHIVPNYVPATISTYNFADINPNQLSAKIENSLSFTKDLYDDYVSMHNFIFQQIGQDTSEDMVQELNYYLQKTGLLNETNIRRIRYMLCKFNIKCEYVVLQKKVHYLYIERVFHRFETEIENEKSRDRLLRLPYQMLRKYSMLVKNHSLEKYSQTVGKAINYINLHLQEPLTLSYISEQIDKNSSFLSNQFKKETGKTITHFIQERRIEAAITLLNTTSLNIQEVGERVGILELNYFSKLFKKHVGMSPSEYKKLIN